MLKYSPVHPKKESLALFNVILGSLRVGRLERIEERVCKFIERILYFWSSASSIFVKRLNNMQFLSDEK